MARLARGGVNTVMLYNALSFPPNQLDQLMNDFAVIGIRVVMMVVEASVNVAAGVPGAAVAFSSLINRLKNFESLLGWYICGESLFRCPRNRCLS